MKLFKNISRVVVSMAMLLQLSGLGPILGGQIAHAADSGLLVPTALHAPSNWDTVTVASLQASDNIYSTDNDQNAVQAQQGLSSFSIPAIASSNTIDGIEVLVEAHSTDTSGCNVTANLSWNNGGAYTVGRSAPITGTDSTQVLGGAADTWGRTWTPSELSNANFVVRILMTDANANSCVNSAIASYDLVQVRVYYSPTPFVDLVVSKTNNVNDNVTIGNSFTWAITGQNNGNTSATFNGSVLLADSLPLNASYSLTPVTVAGGTTGTINCSITLFTLLCSDAIGGQPVVLPAGGSFTVGIITTPSAIGSITNPRSGPLATCAIDPLGVITESNEANNTCSDTVTVNDVPHNGTVTIIKKLMQDNGGTNVASSFGFQVDGGTYTAFEDDASNTLTYVEGTHIAAITEPTATGYTTTYSGCTNITVVANQDQVCTITNDDIAPQLTVVKHVTNTHGGTATAASFEMQVTGPGSFYSAFPGDEAGTTISLPAGGFSVAESGPGGYGASVGTDCAGTLTIGESKTCTITNYDIAPQVTITKEVTNSYGGTLGSTDFPLQLGTANVTSGTTYTVFDAGTYLVSETQQTGYHYSSISGDCYMGNDALIYINLSLGTPAQCTIHNQDTQPKLKVIKHVENTYGGTQEARNFIMNVTGINVSVTGFDGDEAGTDVTLDAGSYSVNEDSHAGYDVTYSAGCSGTIAIGDEKTCTVTNTEIQPTITLIKEVTNDNGGTALPEDFDLAIGDTTVKSGDELPIRSNTGYVLSENQLPGYSFVSITGEGCPESLDQAVSLTSGQHLVCTIVNDDIAPRVTVQKVIYGDVTDSYTFDASFTLGSENTPTSKSFMLDGMYYGETNSYQFTPNAGQVTISEESSSDWLTHISCYNSREVLIFEGLASEVSFDTQLDHDYYCRFENLEKATITLVKFNDANKNGVKDDGEALLSGWNLQANLTDGSEYTAVKSGVTGADGSISFDVLGDFTEAEGLSFTATETQQNGWTQTANYCSDPVEPQNDEVIIKDKLIPSMISKSQRIVPGGNYTCYIGNYKTPEVPVDPPKLSYTGRNSTIAMYLAGAILMSLAGLEYAKRKN